MRDEWLKISENLKKMLEPGIFKVWIAPLSARVEGHALTLTAPSAFVAHWLETKLADTLRRAAAPVLGQDPSHVTVRILSPESQEAHPPHAAAEPAPPRQASLPMPLPVASLPVSAWRFSFEDFIVGPSNNVAAAAARDISSQAGCVRTLFMTAAPGLGKTHLAQAAGRALAEAGRDARVAYLTAEEFASRFVASVRNRDVEGFKARFRDLDVLLLEDVHFLQGKGKMQEMALNVIKSLQSRGGRTVFTSSFLPRDLQQMDSQLVSLFSSGILAAMDRPTEDMRRHILSRKAKSFQVLLPDNVCALLAVHLDGDVRQLEACLENLIFKARLLNRGIDLDLARDILNSYASLPGVPDLATLMRLVCESYGLSRRQLASRSRRKDYVLARNTFYYLARKHTAMTLEEIGGAFNRRHSTVIKGITAVERELARESALGRQLARSVGLIERNAGIGA